MRVRLGTSNGSRVSSTSRV
ncbi:hypothetical protein MTR67_051956 [Solanum verrucosum]|uniref:Uncharacterized protein n=1 Tax=Solanum verrucosum TaxID=315347 RepID=A0AAF0V8H5_SOLVR|nr:hypothetical protein MTR67_051956 [Solanum verrucosum]